MAKKKSFHEGLGLSLGNNAWNALMRGGVTTRAQLLALTHVDLLKIPGLGRRTLVEIIHEVQRTGGAGWGDDALRGQLRAFDVRAAESPVERQLNTLIGRMARLAGENSSATQEVANAVDRILSVAPHLVVKDEL